MGLVDVVKGLDERRADLVKAYVIGRDGAMEISTIEESKRLIEEGTDAWGGAIEPPYDPETLTLLLEHSSSLRPNIDAYSTNIDGFGYRFEPSIKLDAEDALNQVREAMWLEREWKAGRGEIAEPTPDEVAKALEQLKRQALREHAKLERFFAYAYGEGSFVALRRKMRQDLETTGNAFWEVLRSLGGELARFLDVPSQTVKLMPLGKDWVRVAERVEVSPIAFGEADTVRRFRTYVQRDDLGNLVYFKQFGDPRCVSADSGFVYRDEEALKVAEGPEARKASEMMHFAIYSPRTSYGIPRWAGTLIDVMGSRAMEEVNYLYFDNKTVPPLAILVSGGRLGDDSVARIQDFFENELKGRENFHKILILESADTDTSNTATGKAKIVIEPLTQFWQKEEVFGAYDERNADKVGQAFRLPRLLRGETKDFNRATAVSALAFAEEQVFQPERDEFDFWINRWVMPELGIKLWKFRTNSPLTRDPERMTAMATSFVRAGVLVPNEGRELASDVFNRDFPPLSQWWAKQPLPITATGAGPVNEPVQQSGFETESTQEEKIEVVKVPDEEFRSWFRSG